MPERKPREKDTIADYALKHSAAHVLASAVMALYPKAQLAIGPPLEEGFYYDFGNLQISADDLPKIEKKMQEIIGRGDSFSTREVDRKTAEQLLKGQQFKLEMLGELKGKITLVQHGDFADLCEGTHVKNMKELKAITLTKVAGAYWRGDSRNPMLTRIYGVVFESKEKLDRYLKMREEAAQRDHVKLGRDLDLFSFHDSAPGFPFFHEKGTIIWYEIEKYLRELYERHGYSFVITPNIMDKKLWLQSGHWEHYRDHMYFTKVDERDFAVKPMNCPGHILIYKQHLHSYRELPLRLAEFGVLHRHELSGVIHGLTRVRKLTQDDAHIFCTEEQMEEEITGVLALITNIYRTFQFTEYVVNLSTRPEHAMGDPKLWEKAEQALEHALNKAKIPYHAKEGEGAFYGPKIDFDVNDALGRPWQLATIQLDFQMPERFDLTYEGADSKRHRPVMIHRAIIGSFERFLGVLIEHFGGKFPSWLSPVQMRLLTMNEKCTPFARQVCQQFREGGIRVELDDRHETLPKKVRDAQLLKIPYAITIGEKEVETKTLAVRTLDGKVEFGVKVDSFLTQLQREIREKR